MNNPTLLQNLRVIENFPINGIKFQDISTLFSDAKCLHTMVNETVDLYRDKGITKVVGIESRGFMLGTTIANELGAGFVMCRKPGKLPSTTIKQSYEKEYGTDTIEIHSDAITEDDVVLIHDDLLATGGSMRAAYDLVQKFHPKKVYISFIIELLIEGLHGRDTLPENTDITTLMQIK